VIAVVPVRCGALVAGGTAAIAEAGGVGLVVGDGATAAARAVAARAVAVDGESECRELRVLELGAFGPADWAAAVAPHVRDSGTVVLPASPDGRDLAPRLAAELGWPLLAGAIRVTPERAALAWRHGRQIAHFRSSGPFVATLLPGSRSALIADDEVDGLDAGPALAGSGSGNLDTDPAENARGSSGPIIVEIDVTPAAGWRDAELIEVLGADPAVMDLAEASRIIGAGAGIGGPEQLATLELVAAALGASVGATRVVTDAGWLGHDRQIGTTGVAVRPRCYVAFGVSGAAQHIGGLGTPRHVVSVNLDSSCPMMAMADLALVADAQEVLDVLARRVSACVLSEAVSVGATAEISAEVSAAGHAGA
jgi:electron transfer flavoprotein alpha subunit